MPNTLDIIATLLAQSTDESTRRDLQTVLDDVQELSDQTTNALGLMKRRNIEDPLLNNIKDALVVVRGD